MKGIFKKKKVIAAIVALVLAVTGAALSVDIGGETQITELICEVVTCE